MLGLHPVVLHDCLHEHHRVLEGLARGLDDRLLRPLDRFRTEAHLSALRLRRESLRRCRAERAILVSKES